MKPERIIWHHSGDSSHLPQFEKVNTYHKQRGFPKSSRGFYVGYHWFIESDGTILQARAETEIGAHDTGENSNSLGVCLAGNFNHHDVPEVQRLAAALLIGQIRYRWPIPITRIEPHRWDDQTDCPGSRLPDNWLTKQYLKEIAAPHIKVFLWIGETFNLL